VIFAALAAVAVLPLPYAGKITSILDRLELPGPELVQEEGLDAVLAQLSELWNRRTETRARLPERVRLLQAEARRSTREVLDLLSAAPNVEGRLGPNRRRDDARPGVTR
jgi:polysaccharide pyruvyl transferase WcaK-like protein